MPRRPRLVLPDVPLHVTQRGVNRAAVFIDAEDCRFYLELLEETAASGSIRIHAYALMGNHVHSLVSPNQAGDLAHAMRLLNQRYVAGFNRRHRRTGTLWEGRFRSCLVDSQRYVLALYRYIDLNPVRAAMVYAPERYVWSSARSNLGLAFEPWLTPHRVYSALGGDARSRIEAYREWLHAGVTDEDLAAIRLHLQQERALGSPRFQAMVAKALNRPVAVRARGRPRLTGTEDSNE